MAFFGINTQSPQGHGVVIYVEADDLDAAREKLAALDAFDNDQPLVTFLGENREIEVRVYLYGEDLVKNEIEEYD